MNYIAPVVVIRLYLVNQETFRHQRPMLWTYGSHPLAGHGSDV